MRTSGYGGRKITKTIRVYTNEPGDPNHKLTLSGEVEKFAEIVPRGMVRLVGRQGSDIKKTVTIVPEKKYDFKIDGVTAKRGKDITFSLSEKKSMGDGKDGYVLTVENLRTNVGRYFDTLTLSTTSKIQPKISIRVYGDIRENKAQPAKPAS